jgi:acetolactate synthase-1/2/3 large subunit
VYAGNMGFAAARSRSWFNSSVGFGSLGYGLPAAVGAALADPLRTVVCLVGDGGLQFTMAELGTAMEVGARLVLLVFNNRGYGEIKAAMQAIDVAPAGVDLHTPDFVALARAYGWQAQRMETTVPQTQWAQRIGTVVAAARGPTLIELCI